MTTGGSRSGVSPADAYARLCDLERSRSLLEVLVDGWAAWPLIRFEVSMALLALSFPGRRGIGRGERLARALADVPALARLRPARHLVKTYTSALLETAGGCSVDVHFDDVILAAGSTFKIEAHTNPRFSAQGRRAQVPRDLSSAILDLGATILARRAPSRDVAEASRVFADAIGGGLGLHEFDIAWVERRLHRFSTARRVHGAIVDRVRPRFVLVADAGEHALVAAAKERGSVVLELQHGIADRSNPGYAWPDWAAPHRARMPVPDRLLLHGEHWRGELGGAFWGDALRVVGSPRIDRYRQLTAGRSDICTVLFTAQGLDVANVTHFLSDAIERVQSRTAVRLVVRLHPVYDTDKAPWLEGLARLGDRAQVLAGDEGGSTLALLRQSHLHASIASASHYDAIGLGVPTVILPFQTHDVVLPLAHAGHAQVARSPQALADLIAGWRDRTVPGAVSEYYFRPGALAHILRELDLDPEEPGRAS
jgi:hypothetical protein